jgi:hypothetical protein
MKLVYRNGETRVAAAAHGKDPPRAPHREDAPALLNARGIAGWYRNGSAHRGHGPAVLTPEGTITWNKEGKIHREGGPAAVWPDGSQSWWRDGRSLGTADLGIRPGMGSWGPG